MLLGGNVRWKRATDFPRIKLFSSNTGHVKWHFGLQRPLLQTRQNVFLGDLVLTGSTEAPGCVLYVTVAS